MYEFLHSQPTFYVDPTGKYWHVIVRACVGAGRWIARKVAERAARKAAEAAAKRAFQEKLKRAKSDWVKDQMIRRKKFPGNGPDGKPPLK